MTPRQLRVLIRVLAVALALGSIGAGVVSQTSPVNATVHSRTNVILFVHGTAPGQGNNGDCMQSDGCYHSTGCTQDGNGYIHTLITGLKSMPVTGPTFTGKMLTVGYYRQLAGCDIPLFSYGGGGYNPLNITSHTIRYQPLTFQERGAYLNEYIYKIFTANRIAVDLVGHSQGGLVAQAAVLWGQLAAAGTQPAGLTHIDGSAVVTHPIDVPDAVTVDSPHNGLVPGFVGTGPVQCNEPQCYAMVQGSAQLNWLNSDGASTTSGNASGGNPQGVHGTEWTAMNGSKDGDAPDPANPYDHLVTMASGTFMNLPASNKSTFCQYNHNSMLNNQCTWGALTDILTSNDALIGARFPSSILYNSSLQPGQSLTSANGKYRLTMEQAGNLDEYLGGLKIWDTGILNGCSGPAYLAMQDDGNLVIYRQVHSPATQEPCPNDAGQPIWSTHTYSSTRPNPYGPSAGQSFLALQDDGNFGVYNTPYGSTSDFGPPTWNAFNAVAGGNSPLKVYGSMCLDVAGGNAQPGAVAQVWGCTNAYSQQWTISWLDGTIRSMGQCLQGNVGFGLQLWLQPCDAEVDQSWWASPTGLLKNNASGLCLDVSGGGQGYGTPVIEYTCADGKSNQTWAILNIRGLQGNWFGKCLDLPNFSFIDGTKLQLYTCHGGVNQQFSYPGDGTLRTFYNKCLDVTAFNYNPGTLVQIWSCSGGANQQWVVNGDGSISPQAAGGLCIDAFGPSYANGAQIGLYYCLGQDNQKWVTSATSNGRASGDTWENHGVNYNPFPAGQCTWGSMENWYRFTGKHLYVTGDAQYWNTQAQAAGWTVTNLPQANSVVVFQPGVQGAANPGGHNGWVTGINPNGTIHVLEMNDSLYGGWNVWDYRDYTVVPGMSFILAPGTRQMPLPF